MSIRRAIKADQERLGVLWLQLLQEQAAIDPRFGVADDALERWANDFPFWLSDERRRIFIAEEDGVLVGFVTAHRWTPPPIYATANEVYIDELFVVPAERGEGVGGKLVAAVRSWAETVQANRMRIGVLAANEAGQKFWRYVEAQPFSVTFTIELEQTAKTETETRRGRLGF